MGGGFWVNGAKGKTCVAAVRLIMEPIVPSTALQGTAARFLLTSGMKRIGADERARSRFAMVIRKLLREVEFISADDLIAPPRLIKSQGKRVALQRASELTDQLFLKCLAKLKAGVMQYYIATEIDYQFLTPGAERTSFEAGFFAPLKRWMVAAKRLLRDASALALLFEHARLRRTDLWLCFGLRPVCVSRGSTAQYQRSYDTAVNSKVDAIAAMVSGQCSALQANQIARKVKAVISYDEAFTHCLGHAVGVTVHEVLFLDCTDGSCLWGIWASRSIRAMSTGTVL